MAPSEKIQKRVHSWIEDDYRFPWKVVRWSKGVYYNRAPTTLRFYGLLHWLTKTGMASSAPLVAWVYGSISGLLATGVAGVIFVGHSTVSFFDGLSKEKANQSDDNQTDIVVRFGDLLVAHKVKGTLNDIERDDAIRACLGVLEVFSRQITKTRSGDISVSLECQHLQLHALRLQPSGNLHQMSHRASKAVQLGHHQRVSFAHIVQCPLQLRSLGIDGGELLLEDAVAAYSLQVAKLRLKACCLVGG